MSERMELICDFDGNSPRCFIFLSQFLQEYFIFNIISIWGGWLGGGQCSLKFSECYII